MQKPASLRAAITASDPELGRDPDRLRMWIDKGEVRCQQTASRNFEYRYQLTVLIVDYTGHHAVICLAINEWLRANQPDLCQPGIGYEFEAEFIDDRTVDLSFTLPLSEAAVVTARAGGGWDIEHPGEPDPILADDAPLAGADTVLAEGWAGGVRLAPDG